VGTVYRSEHSKWLDGYGKARVRPAACLDERRKVTILHQHPIPGSAGTVHPQIGARPQLWKGLWTESTVQGRRPT
jgi:hypothetical protein